MEELLELRSLLQRQEYRSALQLIDEMEEMGLKQIEKEIRSHIIVLLIHLIKRYAEKHTTRSWDVSIRYAVSEINYENKRRKSGGYYLTEEDIRALVLETYEKALENAALEAFGGAYDSAELGDMVDRTAIETEALTLIWQEA
mgnify:CR=1 FL=1